MDNEPYIKKEDYDEPECPLCMSDGTVVPIDTSRFIQKLDAYYAKKDYDGAQRHLLYWLSEAKAGNDLRGEFTVYNEMMGHYRKAGDRAKAYDAAEKALGLIPVIGIGETAGAGTAYVNAATVYKAFGESEKALPLFEKARAVYGSTLKDDDPRLGGLYNNMALSLADLGRYREAISYYEKAIGIMLKTKNGELEAAISYLNMANAREAESGMEAAEGYISEYIERAAKLLDAPGIPRDGYYAFVCDKCAPVFEYYGYFLYANKYKDEAARIYERT